MPFIKDKKKKKNIFTVRANGVDITIIRRIIIYGRTTALSYRQICAQTKVREYIEVKDKFYTASLLFMDKKEQSRKSTYVDVLCGVLLPPFF